MAQNPLQQYFRQPKIYISLPSRGSFNKPGFVDGDVEHVPVFGMTGMDEILTKTPDALLTGESTVKVVASCIPAIRNPWELSVVDLDTVLTAIRIATYGNKLEIKNNCPKCSHENEYDFDLSTFIEYYANCKFEGKVVVGDLIIHLRPITYKQSTEFGVRNFQMQQQLKQINEIENEEEKSEKISALYEQLAKLQNEVLIEGIDSVEVNNSRITERGYIKEWMENCDAIITDSIREKININQKLWRSPNQKVVCDNCGTESYISISLDQADFFVPA